MNSAASRIARRNAQMLKEAAEIDAPVVIERRGQEPRTVSFAEGVRAMLETDTGRAAMTLGGFNLLRRGCPVAAGDLRVSVAPDPDDDGLVWCGSGRW